MLGSGVDGETRSKFIEGVANEEKSIWEPCQNITWLGLRWDSRKGCISITEKRLSKIYEHIEKIHNRSNGIPVELPYESIIAAIYQMYQNDLNQECQLR